MTIAFVISSRLTGCACAGGLAAALRGGGLRGLRRGGSLGGDARGRGRRDGCDQQGERESGPHKRPRGRARVHHRSLLDGAVFENGTETWADYIQGIRGPDCPIFMNQVARRRTIGRRSEAS